MEQLSEVVPEQVTLRLDWSPAQTAQAQHVNQALAQVGSPGADGMPDGIYVTVGVVPPPPIPGDDDRARAEAVEALKVNGVKVNVAGQFHMSRQMLGDLISVLQTTAAKYDAAVRAAPGQSRGKQGGGLA